MPIIKVDIRGYCASEHKKQLIEDLTKVTNELLSIPPDKIIVIIREIPLSNWGQAGVVGADPNYNVLSRRIGL